MLPYFTLFGKEIPYYGVLYFAGMFAAVLAMLPIYSKRDIKRYDLVYAAVYVGIGATVGAKLLFLIVSVRQIIELNLSFVDVIKGGFVFYGGLIGGLAGLLIYAKQFHMKVIDYFDVFAVVVPLGHAFGRVGCFISGCCYGIHYDGFLSYTYEHSLGDTPLGEPLLPIQLIEAAMLLILFVVLFVLFKRYPDKKGLTSLTYFCTYPVIRFILEFFRGDIVRGSFAGLSTSQWISIILLCAAVITYMLYKNRNKQQDVKVSEI